MRGSAAGGGELLCGEVGLKQVAVHSPADDKGDEIAGG